MGTRIKGSQIREESITGTQVADDTLTGDDIDESTLIITLNDVLENGASTTLDISSGNISPSSDITYNLGSQSFAWNEVYSNSIYTTSLSSPEDLVLDASGGQIYMKDGGVTYLTFNVDGSTDLIEAIGHLKLQASADITLNAQQGDIYFQDNGIQRMRIEDSTGDISIGTHSPLYRLDVRKNTSSFVMNVQQDSTLSGADLVRMDFSAVSDPTGQIFYVYDKDNDRIYQVVGNGAGGSSVSTSFTAGHDTVVPLSSGVIPGMILESTGVIWFKPVDVTSETALPKCQLASSDGSKKVFGVVAGFPEPETVREEDLPYVHNGYVMAPAFPSYAKKAGILDGEINIGTMSIGEGVIWVTNISGNIEAGDLIESSVVPGHGRLQGDDIIRSKTVAKCTEDIDWDSVEDYIDHSGISYKKYLAACTFCCG